MPSLWATSFFLLLSSLSLLQVSVEGISTLRSLEKRDNCPVLFSHDVCVRRKNEVCCKICCDTFKAPVKGYFVSSDWEDDCCKADPDPPPAPQPTSSPQPSPVPQPAPYGQAVPVQLVQPVTPALPTPVQYVQPVPPGQPVYPQPVYIIQPHK